MEITFYLQSKEDKKREKRSKGILGVPIKKIFQTYN